MKRRRRRPLPGRVSACFSRAGTVGSWSPECNPTAPAAKARLRRGDVLVSIDNEPVAASADVARALRKVRDGGREHALVLIERRGQPRFVAVRIEIA